MNRIDKERGHMPPSHKGRDPVRFARNAALFSGVPAALLIVLGFVEGDLVLVVLSLSTLLFALTGVMIWVRRERQNSREEERPFRAEDGD